MPTAGIRDRKRFEDAMLQRQRKDSGVEKSRPFL